MSELNGLQGLEGPPEGSFHDEEDAAEIEPLNSNQGSRRLTRRSRLDKRKRRVLQRPSWQEQAQIFWSMIRSRFMPILLILSSLVNLVLLWDTETFQASPTTSKQHESRANETTFFHRKRKDEKADYPPMCDVLSSPSALDTWNRHISRIHASSRLPSDATYEMHDLTAELLRMVSPRLPQSVQTVAGVRQHETIIRIANKAWERYSYIRRHRQRREFEKRKIKHNIDPNEPVPEPIRITVMGGDVTFGIGCNTGIAFHDEQYCSWPYRLQAFLNTFLGLDGRSDKPAVLVSNVAVRGTNSLVGAALLQYDVLANETDQADIIINAYSTNDHADNSTVDVLSMVQAFYRQAAAPVHPCKQQQKKPPLLLHWNDAIGHLNSPILSAAMISQVAEVLSNHYGVASVSYTNLVRDWIYGDATSQTWFFADAYFIDEADKKLRPGHAMHLTSTWIMAYNLLNLVTTACAVEAWDGNSLGKDEGKNMMRYDPKIVPGLPMIRNASDINLKGKPHEPPSGLPPSLSTTISVGQLSKRWQANKRTSEPKAASDCSNSIGDDSMYRQCPFAWVSDHGNVGSRWVHENVMSRFVDDGSSWELQAPHTSQIGLHPPQFLDPRRKHPRTPSQIKGTYMTLEFANQTQSVRSIVIFITKSNQPEWTDSMARVDVTLLNTTDNTWHRVVHQDISGHHEHLATEMSVGSVALKTPIEIGGTLRIRFTLLKGTMFKLMGLALCS